VVREGFGCFETLAKAHTHITSHQYVARRRRVVEKQVPRYLGIYPVLCRCWGSVGIKTGVRGSGSKGTWAR
jgi:hypothetical protein